MVSGSRRRHCKFERKLNLIECSINVKVHIVNCHSKLVRQCANVHSLSGYVWLLVKVGILHRLFGRDSLHRIHAEQLLQQNERL